MSEPQTKPVEELMDKNASTDEQQHTLVEESPLGGTPTSPEDTNSPSATDISVGSNDNAAAVQTQDSNDQHAALTGDLKTLKDAFPNLDVDIIETILNSQGGNLNAAFDVLLGMSDPSYKPDPQETQNLEQMRRDEEFAKQLARNSAARYQQQVNAQRQAQLQQQAQREQEQQQQPLFNLQEDLPMIKEKVMEVGAAAKNKIMSLYNQFMVGPSDQPQAQQQPVRTSSLETRMGNMSLSSNQERFQAQEQQHQNRRESVDLYEWDGRGTDAQQPQLKTTTPAGQLLSDEDFARQLAREDAEAAHVPASEAPQSLGNSQQSATSPSLTASTKEPTVETNSDRELSDK